MSRRRVAAKREIIPDPKYADNVVAKFINSVLKSGKKHLARKIVYDAFDMAESRSKHTGLEIFKKAVQNVKPVLEIRARRVGGATYQIPTEVRSIDRSEIYIAENHQGVVDTVFRKFQLTARQAVQRFGADTLPDKIVTDAEERPDTQHEFLHAVFPNPERVRGALNHRHHHPSHPRGFLLATPQG